ncbi:MAG: hypothetical protein CMH55_07780 [Myxococcales bacterium]|nr:hypothetical protein [Myxococcales bacterium]
MSVLMPEIIVHRWDPAVERPLTCAFMRCGQCGATRACSSDPKAKWEPELAEVCEHMDQRRRDHGSVADSRPEIHRFEHPAQAALEGFQC